MAQFTNQARLSYNDTVIDSNIAVGEIREVLTASKTAVNSTYRADDRVPMSSALSMQAASHKPT